MRWELLGSVRPHVWPGAWEFHDLVGLLKSELSLESFVVMAGDGRGPGQEFRVSGGVFAHVSA